MLQGKPTHEEDDVGVIDLAHDLHLLPEVSQRLFIEVRSEESLHRNFDTAALTPDHSNEQ